MKIALYIILHALFPAQYTPFGAGVNSSGPASTPFLTTQTVGATRSNITGCVGYAFSIGITPITVTDLGWWVTSGNSASHTIVLTGTGGFTTVTASVNTSGAPSGAWLYAAITPVVLGALTNYSFYGTVITSGDQWLDNTSVTSTAVGTVTFSAFQTNAPTCTTGGGLPFSGSVGFGTPNFKYHL